MHRFYLSPEQCAGNTLSLTGREAHHALRVLRVRPADRLTILDGAGREFLCEINECERGSVRLTVVQKNSIAPLPCQITLAQALPKGRIIEDIIQKAVELGVARIVPLLSDRVIARLNAAESAAKAEKWRGVAIEAIKQCGAAWLPKVDTPLTPRQFLARKEKFDLTLVGSLQAGRRHPRDVLREFQANHGSSPCSACVWIGPEGDFTAEELDAIQRAGALPISLGRLVLRVETAAIYCLSILNYELQLPARES